MTRLGAEGHSSRRGKPLTCYRPNYQFISIFFYYTEQHKTVLWQITEINFKTLIQEICGNRIKAGFFNVIIQDIAVPGTYD